MPGALVLVAGPAGAGKSTLARQIAATIGRTVVLDKDTLTGPFVGRLLAALGGVPTDRESNLYRQEVRPLEYAALMDAAFENMHAADCVLAAAPFAAQLTDPAWLVALRSRASAIGAGVGLLWTTAPAPLLRERISARAEARDAWKLAHWDDYAAATALAIPPGLPAWLAVREVDAASPPDLRTLTVFVRAVQARSVSLS